MSGETSSNIDSIASRLVARPRVTVITIFFNAEKFLIEAIESVLNQSFDEWEYLLVDDGSTDEGTAIAESYAARYPEKIRYLEHSGHANRGMSAARNLGIQRARGDYIAFIDADDVWMPNKLSDQVAILNEYPEVDMVCGAVVHWSSWSMGEDIVLSTGHRQDVVVFPPEASLATYPLGSASSPFPSDMMVRTTSARALGGFEEQFTSMYEDQAFLSKLYLVAPVYFSSKIWLKYRVHADSCVATAHATGKYHDSRMLFLSWFEAYLADRKDTNRLVLAALHRALRRYRRPRIDFLLTLPSKLQRRYRGLLSLVGRIIAGDRRPNPRGN